MSNLPRDPTRLRQGLNPLLTTSLAVSAFQNQVGSPSSAVSSHQYSTSQTPLSAIQPYNPQEWVASPTVGPERTHQHYPGGSEASALPPPPYSPPRSSRPVSQIYETTAANTSVPRIPPINGHRPSPDPPTNAPNPVFPPPPPTGGRGNSRERRFLPSFGRRKETEHTPPSLTPPEPHPSASLSRPTHGHTPQLSIQIPADAHGIAPGARRAVSTPAAATPTSARSRSSSQVRWDPAMPVPPPPPGPPPSQPRSQSVSRAMEIPTMVAPPTRRPPPSGVSNLGPVPPTPADWVDSDHPRPSPRPLAQMRGPSPHPGLSVDTSSIGSSTQGHESLTSATSSTPSGGLGRSPALRGEKSLRQRRAESKSRHLSHGSIDGALEDQLSDIVVPNGQGLTRRLTIGRNTPRSAKFGQDAHQQQKRNGEQQGDEHTPRAAQNSVPTTARHPETPTPPFSPRPQKPYNIDPSPSIAPKALPTPPPQNRSGSQVRGGKSRASSSENPQSPRLVMKQMAVAQSPEQFCQSTIDRYESFAHREMTATSDQERVRLFAEFMVSESRIRRERYFQAIGAMGSEIFDLTRDLFRPMVSRRDSLASQAEFTPKMPDSSRFLHGAPGPSGTNSAPTSAGIDSPMSTPGTGGSGNEPWPSGNGYIPSLSPILSMSVSEGHLDESSSRGRPASRWWETDSSGPSSQRLERSKRESKYMGVPREAWHFEEAASGSGSSSKPARNDYPPEKVGWHEASSDASVTPQPLRLSTASISSPSPYTPNPSTRDGAANPHALDVSRLVTLPPSYPRHHPAVNNNHPNLTSIRTQVRTLSDLTEVEKTNERFLAASTKLRSEAAEAAKTRKSTLRTNLSAEISSGRMSYAEAASIEADSAQAEKDASKDLEKADFERFQSDVVTPLHDLLTSRIDQASKLFDELRSRLFSENQTTDPNRPQEEGDETPELLEKLTLLKWIFEARESLHRAVYDLLSDRNDRYKEMIVTPYRLSGNDQKLRNAEHFFAEDGASRATAFAEEGMRRTQQFRDVVEENVVRGVEIQSSAFWDIAPPLKSVLDKIPDDVPRSSPRFAVQIPGAEYDENPQYHRHPLQYLYSLLLHAEKSTYQFIESQTNLLCLLHEVKETVIASKGKVMEREGRDAERIGEAARDEEGRLDEDLKEKVRVVQDQWGDALGEAFGSVKARVGEFLLQTGGWDETLEDSGVGAA
ncbi:hypothetical protein MKZ38_003564 [Zalerion maritima]|uniref:Uncharacterized protein n=1 Tax=Zalerion maritima TaxID=339359 RepID=A0AAD5WQ64_9PEZI|nr:hypothetical protein MKZ38_003564 [Zalerion maritima]